MLKTPEKIWELQRKLYQKAKQLSCESPWKKMIGKPYSGKLNVRFDEGELEPGPRQVGLRRHLRKGWQEPPKAQRYCASFLLYHSQYLFTYAPFKDSSCPLLENFKKSILQALTQEALFYHLLNTRFEFIKTGQRVIELFSGKPKMF